jgi:hypothetical protein
VHDVILLQTILTELAAANGVRDLKNAPAPNTGTMHSVADSVSFLNTMMNSNTYSEYTESAYGASSNSGSSEERRKYCKREHNKTKIPPSLAGKRRKQRTRVTSQRRTHAPTARNTTAGSPIALNRTNACRTRSIRDTASSQSVMSLK